MDDVKKTAQQLDLKQVMQRINFNRLLGIRFVRAHKDGVTIECPLRPELLNIAHVLHGGVAATVADVAVGFAISNHFQGSRRHTTVELKINYLAPVTDGKIVARSRLVRVGKHLAIGEVDLRDGRRRRVGVAIVTYMLL
jgi:uncharacterized protein (TIGR00369 family)